MIGASFSVVLGSQNVFAGVGGCSVDPNELDFGTFASDVLVTIPKTVTCSEGVDGIIASPSDCIDKGILVSFENAGIIGSVWMADEIIGTSAPDGTEVHCAVEFTVFDDFGGTSIIFQDIWLIPDEFVPVGGELLPLNTTALLLAGAQSFSWMIPVVLSVLGIGLFVVSRKSENS